MGSFKDLIVYRKAFDLAMWIFAETKGFPVDERYGLTSQSQLPIEYYDRDKEN